VREGGVEYVVDLAIPCREGTVLIAVGERPAPPGALYCPDVETVRRAVAACGGEMGLTQRHRDTEIYKN